VYYDTGPNTKSASNNSANQKLSFVLNYSVVCMLLFIHQLQILTSVLVALLVVNTVVVTMLVVFTALVMMGIL